MATKQNHGMVQIPAVTLNALKGLLFDGEGVDLTSIIKDLGCGEVNDLTAIHVALTFKGIAPKIDDTTRYRYRWDNQWEECRLLGHSLILDMVRIECITYKGEAKHDTATETLRLVEWYKMTTDKNEVLSKLK